MSRLTFDRTIGLLNELYHGPLVPASEARLERAAYLLGQVGNPHRSFRSVHVAGSTGKGSTTTMIGSILQAAGFRTGYFRSPHLHAYTERIAVDGQDIDVEAWVRCFNRLWPVVEAMRHGEATDYRLGRPALFEVLFALASLHFRDTGIQWAAVETGLGGRLDATNLLRSDVAVVTNVSLEHTHVLGKTVPAIAAEKAAIIKEGSYAVTAADDPEALRVIAEQADRVGVPLLQVGRDVAVSIRHQSIHGQELTLKGKGTELEVRLPVAGHFQSVNAATAFAAMQALRDRGTVVGDEAIRQGLESVRVPGRFELVSSHPMIVLDGAHNPAGARELRTSIQQVIPERQRIVLFATMTDKDVGAMAAEIGPLADEVIVTRPPDADRGASATSAALAFQPWTSRVRTENDAERALTIALAATGPESVLIVTGSLYLVGYVRHALATALVSS